MQGVAFLLVLLLLTQATTFAASSVSKRLSGALLGHCQHTLSNRQLHGVVQPVNFTKLADACDACATM